MRGKKGTKSPPAASKPSVTNATYDAPSRTLTVTFASGVVYDYGNIDERTASDMMSAPSLGKYLRDNIVPFNSGMRR